MKGELIMEHESSLELESLLEQTKRRDLIPIWIKVFIWIFIITGGLTVPVFLFALIGNSTTLAIYGLETNDGLSVTGLIIFALFIFKGLTALALWTENDWAITCGIIDAALGIVICLGFTVAPLYNSQIPFVFRLELVALIPYLVWLLRVKNEWESI